jgi:hypothetical protein
MCIAATTQLGSPIRENWVATDARDAKYNLRKLKKHFAIGEKPRQPSGVGLGLRSTGVK